MVLAKPVYIDFDVSMVKNIVHSPCHPPPQGSRILALLSDIWGFCSAVHSFLDFTDYILIHFQNFTDVSKDLQPKQQASKGHTGWDKSTECLESAVFKLLRSWSLIPRILGNWLSFSPPRQNFLLSLFCWDFLVSVGGDDDWPPLIYSTEKMFHSTWIFSFTFSKKLFLLTNWSANMRLTTFT